MNINREGDSYKTVIGGICSIIIKLFMIFYVYMVFMRIGNNKSYISNNNIVQSNVDVTPVNYDHNLKFMLMPSISKVRNGPRKIKYDNETK